MRKTLLALSLLTLLLPLSVSAYGKRRIGATTAMSRASTKGTFVDRQIWLPGTWTVKQDPTELTMQKKHADGIHVSTVHLKIIPRNDCAYGFVRIRALKAWGGSNLEQSQGRIETVSLGTSKFRGYSWIEPSTWGGTRHWCVGQDLRNALELTATAGDTELMTFIKNDLMLQLATRSGRSVLPWPSASEYSSSSSR